jgi:methylenetetrahydrofolate reductase (NADPH)
MARIGDLLAAGRTFSFEFSPPKSAAGSLSLGRTIAELEPLGPSFVSVTYGAGGSTREFTRDTVQWVRKETNIPPMAHLTCVGHTRAEINDIIATYVGAGIENVLALAGDPPKHAGAGRDGAGSFPTAPGFWRIDFSIQGGVLKNAEHGACSRL